MSSTHREYHTASSFSSPASMSLSKLQRVDSRTYSPHTIKREPQPLSQERLEELRRWYCVMRSKGHVLDHVNRIDLPVSRKPNFVNLNDICPENPISLKNQEFTPVQEQKRYHNLLFGPKQSAKEYRNIWSDGYWLDHVARVIADNETDFIGKKAYEKACLDAKINFQKAVDAKTEKYMRYFDEAVDLNEEPWVSNYESTNDISIIFYEKAAKTEMVRQLRSAVARQLAFEEECESAGRGMADAMGVTYPGKEGCILSFEPPFLNPPWELVDYTTSDQYNTDMSSRPSILQNDILLTVRKHEQWIICQGRKFYKQQCGVINVIGKLLEFYPERKGFIYCPRQELYRMRIELLVDGIRMNEPPLGDKDTKFWGSIYLFSSQKILYDTTMLEVKRSTSIGNKKCQMQATGKGLWTFLRSVKDEKHSSPPEQVFTEKLENCDEVTFTLAHDDEADNDFIEHTTPDITTSAGVATQSISQATDRKSSPVDDVDQKSETKGRQSFFVMMDNQHDDDVSENESDGDSVVSLVKLSV